MILLCVVRNARPDPLFRLGHDFGPSSKTTTRTTPFHFRRITIEFIGRKNEKKETRKRQRKAPFGKRLSENARRWKKQSRIEMGNILTEFLVHLKSLPKITQFNPRLSTLPLADSVFYIWFMILIFETIPNLWIYFSASFFETFRLLFRLKGKRMGKFPFSDSEDCGGKRRGSKSEIINHEIILTDARARHSVL